MATCHGASVIGIASPPMMRGLTAADADADEAATSAAATTRHATSRRLAPKAINLIIGRLTADRKSRLRYTGLRATC